MNTRHVSLLALLPALVLSGSGCKKSEKPIVAGPPPSGPVELKLRWPENRRIEQTFHSQQTVEVPVPKPTKQDVQLDQTFHLSVVKEEPDGGHVVDFEITRMRMGVGTGGQIMEADTQNPSSTSNAMGAAIARLTGAQLRFILDASNAVVRIEGMDDFQKRLNNGPKDPTGMTSSIFSEGYFKQMMGMNAMLPKGPVAPGDTYPVQTEFSLGQMGTLLLETTNTFKEWERRKDHNCARIEFTGVMKSKQGQPLVINGAKMTISSGTLSGETYFDLDAGMFVSSTANQEMTLNLSLPTRRGTPPQNITIGVNQTSTFEAVLKK